MFQLHGTPRVERFELVLVGVRSPFGEMHVPLVDGWLEVQLALGRVPDHEGRGAFFAALGRLCDELRYLLPELRWYFLHKPPGIKLRFQVGAPDGRVLDTILSGITGWSFPWVHATAIGSLFDQTELLAAAYRHDVEALLTIAADGHLLAAAERRSCPEECWADFLVALLDRLGLDRWLAYEALSRLARLRAVELVGPPSENAAPLDPWHLLARLPAGFSPGFAASVSLLQGLNLMFNIWALDAGAQLRILNLAREATRPCLLAVRP